jgi:Transcriptional regulator, AbiEi antitoxin
VTDEIHADGGFRQARAARAAARQWGNIERRQLRALGFTSREVDGMAERGLLYRLHRGVYAFGALSPAPEQRWAAALLAAGQGCALSHTGAAGLYGQLPVREVIEVTAPYQRRGDERLKVHTAKRFDWVQRRGIRVTTPAQTLLDLAAIGWPIDRMTHELAASGQVSLDTLRAFARERRGQRGAAALRAALELPHTRSSWEREFLAWVRTLDVPLPILNARVGRLTVDCHWPADGLVVELDTDQTHGSAFKRRDDAARDLWLQRRGKEVWRVRREAWDREALADALRGRLAS